MYKKWIKYILGILITILALWLSFHDMDWPSVRDSFLRIDLFWVGASILCTLFTVYAIGWRWSLLLKKEDNFSMWYMFKLNIISQYINIVSPLRIGEIAKAWIPSKQKNISGSYVLGTILIEKIFDFFSWAILWVIAPAFLVAFRDKLRGYTLALIISAIMVVFLVIMAWKPQLVRRWIFFFSQFLPHRFREKIRNFLERGMDSFSSLKSIRTSFLLILYTAFIIILSSFSNYLLFKAFRFHLTLFDGLILLLIVQIGSVPPSVPGKIGIFEYMVILGLTLFGISKTDALSYGLMLHLVSFVPKILLGFFFMAGLNFSIKNVETQMRKIEQTETENADKKTLNVEMED